MRLTSDEHRALAFIAAILCLSAAVRVLALPEPVEVPGEGGVDLAAHIEAVERVVGEAEEAARPLEPGETIDPNTATATQLKRLPRVGPALADRIIADRNANGRYRTLADLGRVAGVGGRTLELLAPHVRLAPGRAVERRSPDPAATAGTTVDLNRATAADLIALPGIGPVLAARIVAFRDSAGPFRALADLEQVKGIGPATLARIGGRVVVR